MNTRAMRRRDRRTPFGRTLVALLTAGLVLAACGGADDADEPAVADDPAEESEDDAADDPEDGEAESDESDDTDTDPEPAGEPEQSEVTVATIPIMAMAPFFHALDSGIFEEEGLDVTHAIGSGGAELIPRLLSGEIDIFWTALEPFIVARSEGVELDLVAPGHYYEAINGEGIGLYALSDAGIDSIADLGDTTIAINTLNTFGHIFTQAALEAEGVDLDSIRWVEIPFPQMAPALERGEVDAMWTPEPFASLAANTIGSVPVLASDAPEPIMADLPAFRDAPGGAWGATAAFAEENPNTVAAFYRAIIRANDEIHNDHELGVQTMVANSESSEDALRASIWPVWSEDLDLPAQVQVSADLMLEYGVLSEAIDTSPYMHDTLR